MILKYGSYPFPANNPIFTISIDAMLDDQGRISSHKHTWIVDGFLEADTHADITSAINALEAAMVNGRDLIFYDDDGSTVTAHGLVSSRSASGVKVMKIEYPEGGDGQYANKRTFRLTFEATYVTGSTILSFVQTIKLTGTGGPRFVYKVPPVGTPVRQFLSERTTYRASQTGSAVGLNGFPTVPAPLWPSYVKHESSESTKLFPTVDPDGVKRYEIGWGFEFESHVPLISTI